MWAGVALISLFLPFLFNQVGMDYLYDTTKDLSFLAVAFAWYEATPFRDFYFKVISSISFCVVSIMTLNNVVLDYSGITQPEHHMIAFLSVVALCFFMLFFVLNRYDSMPDIKLQKGTFYHVFGRPRHNIGMIGFYLSLGKYGEHYITNGIYVWKFFKSSGRYERVPFAKKYVHNRKLVLINGDISDKLNALLGSKWAYFNSCRMYAGLK